MLANLCSDSVTVQQLSLELRETLNDRSSSAIAESSDRIATQKILSVSTSLGVTSLLPSVAFSAAQTAFNQGKLLDPATISLDLPAIFTRLSERLAGVEQLLKSSDAAAAAAVTAFVEVAFHPAMMVIQGLDDCALHAVWAMLERAFINGQPAAFCEMLRHCTTCVWSHHTLCTQRWTSQICDALTLRPARSGFCSQDLLLDAAAGAAAAYPRVAVTSFFCRAPAVDVVRELLKRAAVEALESRKCMPQSDAYFQQLHIWQTLCCVSNGAESEFMDEEDELFGSALCALEQGFLPEIRQLMDMTVVNCVLRKPTELLPRLLERARDPQLANATASSLLIDIMLVVRHIAPGAAPEGWKMEVLHTVLPSATSPNGLVRIAAQHTLRTVMENTELGDEAAVWKRMLTFLQGNKELGKMFNRQDTWVAGYDPRKNATVQKLMVEGQDLYGEVHPSAVVYEMKRAMKEVFDEASAQL